MKIQENVPFPPGGMEAVADYDCLPVPYLENPPEVIDVSVGRQLFVDDYLIESTTFVRQYHQPRRYPGNPVLSPETAMERGFDGHTAMAAPFSDGVWYDGTDGKWKMWYHAGWFDGTAYAESEDGIHWNRVPCGIGTDADVNRCIPVRPGVMRDGCAVVLNRYYKEEYPYKMFLYVRPGGGEIWKSADGKQWERVASTGPIGDRSTMFYNPFRRKWVYSMRTDFGPGQPIRARSYAEADTLEEGAPLTHPVYWVRADRYDPVLAEVGDVPTLYNLDAVAYESVLLGAFTIFCGPENDVCDRTGIPKHTELHLAYSRDGFHWYRPKERTAFLRPAYGDPDSWERGYLHSNNALCVINGDELWFYYTAFRGDESKVNRPPHEDGMYDNASTGLAILRRDGFASMNASRYRAVLTTRPLSAGGEYLFVNGDFHKGSLRAAVLDESGKPIPGYTEADCVPMETDSTCCRLTWNGHATLDGRNGRSFRLRFEGTNGSLYAFWLSDHEDGRSHGYLAGGAVGKPTYCDE